MNRNKLRQWITLGALTAVLSMVAAFAAATSEGGAGVVSAQTGDPTDLSPVPSDSSQAWFMKVGDIKGESTDDAHMDWINLLSVSNSITRPMGAGASGSTRHRSSATFGDVVCVKEVDASTPKLQEAIAKGTVFPKVEIHLTTSSISDAGRVTYYAYELKNVQITSYSLSGSAADGRPLEEVSFNYEEIKTTYTKQNRDGSSGGNVEFEWKVEEGTK